MSAPRGRWVATLVGACALALPAGAAAHVDVLPTTVTQGVGTEFTLRVPNERDVPTTQVRVRFPDQVTVYSFARAPAGFTATPTRSPDGRIVGVVYRGTIPVGGYQDFSFLGTPFDAGETRWPSNQVYADGVVKRWIGPPEQPGQEAAETGPDEPGPAAGVTVVAPQASTPAATSVGNGGGSSGGAGTWLGLAGLVAGLGALGWTAVGTRRERRRREPAQVDSPQ